MRRAGISAKVGGKGGIAPMPPCLPQGAALSSVHWGLCGCSPYARATGPPCGRCGLPGSRKDPGFHSDRQGNGRGIPSTRVAPCNSPLPAVRRGLLCACFFNLNTVSCLKKIQTC